MKATWTSWPSDDSRQAGSSVLITFEERSPGMSFLVKSPTVARILADLLNEFDGDDDGLFSISQHLSRAAFLAQRQWLKEGWAATDEEE